MKHEEASRLTRQQLADTLKKRMAQKPLSKITVSELAGDCGMNRKTFYYHFVDIYDLFIWMLEQETFEIIKQFDMLLDFHEVLQFAADYILNNHYMINAAYDSMGREGLKRFLYRDFIGLANSLIDSAAQQQGVKLCNSYQAFLCDFFTEAIANTLLSWVQKPDVIAREKEQNLSYVEHLMLNALPEVIRSSKDKGPGFVESFCNT